MMLSDGFFCGIGLGIVAGIILMKTCPQVQEAVKKGEKLIMDGKKEIKKQAEKL